MAADVWIPLRPPPISNCPNVDLPSLPDVVRRTGTIPQALQTWALAMLAYPLGTILRDTVGNEPVVARLECHDYYGADPSKPPKWHKGVSVYWPATRDATGKLVPVTSPPSGWPGS